ncbi:MAG: hypothetical protein J6Y85_00605 [Alphaproteobacteria bacterium]|nr:hypothetical protein [Alphaproteobacteria bacterium]
MHIIAFIFYIILLGISFPLHAQERSSDFQEFAFGKARILSCLTGIQKQKKLYTGIHILPNEDWSIQDPQLTWTASDGSVGKGFFPLFQPFADELIYPAIFILKQNEQKTTYTAQGNIRACRTQSGCHDFPADFNLTLSPQPALQTPQCMAIITSLTHTPKPWPNTIRGQAINKNDSVHIMLQLPKPSTRIKLFNPDRTPLIPQNIQFEHLMVSFDLPSSDYDHTSFILKTPDDLYEIKLPISDPTTPPMNSKIPVSGWIQLLLCSLLFSPLFMAWGNNNHISVQSCKKFNYYICIAIVLAFGIGLCCTPFPHLWATQPLHKYLSIALILVTLLWGKASPFLILLGVIFMPKPLWDTLQIVSTSDRILFLLSLSAIWFILFGLKIKYAPHIHRFFKQWYKPTPKGAQASFALPLLLLLCYTIFYL